MNHSIKRCIMIVSTLAFSVHASANCFYDQFGNQTCIINSPPVDYKRDYNELNVYQNGQSMQREYNHFNPATIRPEVPYTPATMNDTYRGLNLR
jgi:hypothetical protein